MKQSSLLCSFPGLFLFGLFLLSFSPAQAQQLAWQTPAPNSRSIHVSAEGNVTVIDDTGTLRSFDPNGQVRWSLALGSPAVDQLVPTADGGFVVATENSHLVSVFPSGQKRFDVTLPAMANGSPAVGADGTVYVAAGTKLLAYSSSGDPKWTYDDAVALTNTPAIGANGVAIGAKEGSVYFVDLSGKLIYTYAVVGDPASRLLVTPAGLVNYLATNNQIIGLDAQGKDTTFVREPDDPDVRYALGKEATKDGIFYVVVGSRQIQAILPDGSVGWTYDVGTDVSTPLTFTSDNRLIFGTSDARIVIIDLQGQKQSETKIGGTPGGVASASGGRYYALLGNGTAVGGADLLVALVPTDTTPPLWTPSGLAGEQILDFARSPKDAHTVYASGDKKLWVSTDDGKNWTPIDFPTGEGDTHINHVTVASNGTVYATTQYFIYASDAAGANFEITFRQEDIGPVAVNPKDPANVIYANVLEPTLYTSPNKGVSSNPEDAPAIFSELLWAADETQYAGSKDGLYRRVKGGTWTQVAPGPFTQLLASDDGKIVYAGGAGRVLRSTDNGNTFQELGGNRFVGTVYSIAMNPASPSELMAGTVFPADALANVTIRGINLYTSKDAGETWTVLNKGLSSIDPHDLIGVNGAFLLASNDGVWRIDASGGGPGPVTRKRGDLNGDDKVNVQDATLALRIAVGLVTPTAEQLTAGDVAPTSKPDGKINVTDATRILRAAIGLDTL